MGRHKLACACVHLRHCPLRSAKLSLLADSGHKVYRLMTQTERDALRDEMATGSYEYWPYATMDGDMTSTFGGVYDEDEGVTVLPIVPTRASRVSAEGRGDGRKCRARSLLWRRKHEPPAIPDGATIVIRSEDEYLEALAELDGWPSLRDLAGEALWRASGLQAAIEAYERIHADPWF